MEDSAREMPRRAVPAWLLWGTWVVGPASFGLAFVCYVVAPELYYGHADPPPDPSLGCMMVMTHIVAGTCTVVMLLMRGPHWRAAEFWVLLLYWSGIAGWILPGVWAIAASRTMDPAIPWLCMKVSAAAVVLMPAAGLARRLMVRNRGPAQKGA